MNYEPTIASGIRRFRPAREFQELFPNAEHAICEAKRDTPDGWQLGQEWISRAPLHNRYAVWLVAAIEINSEGDVSEIEKPTVGLPPSREPIIKLELGLSQRQPASIAEA